MMVRVHIGQYVEERGLQDVGVPSLIEAGDCLVKCGGRMNEAIALCARRREEKVGAPGMGKFAQCSVQCLMQQFVLSELCLHVFK